MGHHLPGVPVCKDLFSAIVHISSRYYYNEKQQSNSIEQVKPDNTEQGGYLY
jgi:hypothetical protein